MEPLEISKRRFDECCERGVLEAFEVFLAKDKASDDWDLGERILELVEVDFGTWYDSESCTVRVVLCDSTGGLFGEICDDLKCQSPLVWFSVPALETLE